MVTRAVQGNAGSLRDHRRNRRRPKTLSSPQPKRESGAAGHRPDQNAAVGRERGEGFLSPAYPARLLHLESSHSPRDGGPAGGKEEELVQPIRRQMYPTGTARPRRFVGRGFFV